MAKLTRSSMNPFVMKLKQIFAIWACLLCPIILLGQESLPTDFFQPIKQQIQQWVAEETVPSMAVAVAKEGEVVWVDAYGWANREKQVPATPNTIYALGSLAKSMAATGMMTLVEQEKISLDDPIAPLIHPAQLRSYHDSTEDVRLRHILNMSAGIPHGWATIPDSIFTGFSREAQKQFTEQIGLITFPPGQVQQYANYSYWFLDMLMERLSGKDLETYMQEAVFQPLGMHNSYTRFERSRAKDFATPYSGNSPKAPYHFLPYGGGGYYSTAEDLIHYGLFYLKHLQKGQEKILSDETIDLMHNYEAGADGLFQIGWFNSGNTVISNGNITGANSMILLVPTEDIAIVCLTNTHTNSYADQIAFQILNHMLPGFDMGVNPEIYANTYETPYQSDDRLLGEWSGKIHSQDALLSIRLRFEQDGVVYIQIGNNTPTQVNDPIFNQLGKLEGSFSAHIPVPEKLDQEKSRCILTLVYDERQLYGHVQTMFNHSDGSGYSFAAYVKLEKR